MNTSTAAIIKREASDLATRFGWDRKRALALLKRSAVDLRAQSLAVATSPESIPPDKLWFCVRFEDAAHYLGDGALDVLEAQPDLFAVGRRAHTFDYLAAPTTPLRTKEEIARHLKSLSKVLEAGKDHLDRFGFCEKAYFGQSWLTSSILTCYPTKFPGALEIDLKKNAVTLRWAAAARRIGRCDLRYDGRYVGKRTYELRLLPPTDPPATIRATAEAVPPLAELTPAEAARLDELRPKVTAARIDVLRRLSRHLSKDWSADLAEDCFSAILVELGERELAFLFDIDRRFRDVDVVTGDVKGAGVVMDIGGLSDTVELIAVCESELEFGVLDETARACRGFTLGGIPLLPPFANAQNSYFTLLASPWHEPLDEILDAHDKREKKLDGFWGDFRARLKAKLADATTECELNIRCRRGDADVVRSALEARAVEVLRDQRSLRAQSKASAGYPRRHPLMAKCKPDPQSGRQADVGLAALFRSPKWSATIAEFRAAGVRSKSEDPALCRTLFEAINERWPVAKAFLRMRRGDKAGLALHGLFLTEKPSAQRSTREHRSD